MWINASTPPENGETVLVAFRKVGQTEKNCRERCGSGHYYEIMYYVDDDWWDQDEIEKEIGEKITILAWQPLPKEWEEENEEV